MNTLEKAINTLNSLTVNRKQIAIDSRMLLVVTIAYIAAVLSVPATEPGRLVWMFAYPIVMGEASGIGYLKVTVKSLWVLPLIIIIGIFNPLIDTAPMWRIGDVAISRGWVTFIGVTLRGLLALQALIILVGIIGFNDLCRGLRSLGVPKVLCTQLLMLYRYLTVLLQEALTMHRAREARGFGRRNYPLKMWGTFVGQLLMRTVQRARRINDAMEARGFTGDLPRSTSGRPSAASWGYLVVWLGIFAAMRFVNFSELLNRLL